MPPVWINDSGTWREATQIYANDGAWRDVTTQWAKDSSGEWRKVFEKGGNTPIPAPFAGTYGFYGYNESNSGRIIVVDRDTNGVDTVVADFTNIVEYVKFSPDGDTLVIVEPSSSGAVRIRHRSASAFSTTTQTFSYGAGNSRPTIVWSEDGLLMVMLYRREAASPFGSFCNVYTRPSTATTTWTAHGAFHGASAIEPNNGVDLNVRISPNKQHLVIWSTNATTEYIRAYAYNGVSYNSSPITIPLPPNWDQTWSFVWTNDSAVAVMGYQETPNSRPGFEYTGAAYSYSISGNVFSLGSEVGSVSSNEFSTNVAEGASQAFAISFMSSSDTYHVLRYNLPGSDNNFDRWERVSGATFAQLPPNTTPIIAYNIMSFYGDPYYDRDLNTASIYLGGSGYGDTYEAYSVNGELIVGPALPDYPAALLSYPYGGRIVTPYTVAPPYG